MVSDAPARGPTKSTRAPIEYTSAGTFFNWANCGGTGAMASGKAINGWMGSTSSTAARSGGSAMRPKS